MSVRSVRDIRWLSGLVAALILCSGSCEISPKPEPPDATLDPNRVDVGAAEDDTGPTRGDGVVVSGAAGAASPAGATVRAYNLDSTNSYVETTVAEDGSFELVVPAEPGDEIRIQVIAEGARSQPTDAEAPPLEGVDAQPGAVAGAVDACVQIDPPAELVLAAESGVIEIRNACATDVAVAAPTTRIDPSALAVGAGAVWPATVLPGESLSVTVEMVAGAAFDEEIVFLWIGTTPERTAITVYRAD